ncbi:MAG: hypothetical protein HOD92_16945 [Deltaproteobacteria bacterium]|nr:hypothetical protein [Deltaproteobacteria bacterium]MBT4526412.1 hypothetical protein [Deltaproteobacteria bacterium]
MNRKILLLMIGLLLPISIYAQSDYAFKISGGMINTPNIDEEIVINEDDPEMLFKEYEGKEGYVYKLSAVIKYAEFGYKILNYTAEKDKDGEKGDIEFDTQTAYAAIYFGDPVAFAGLNMSIGVGTGITKLTINREFEGNPSKIENGLAYAKETHYFAGLHYGMSDTYGFSLAYEAQTMKTVVGNDFTNDFVELTIDYMF